jgi:hypothetical protein
MLRAFCLLACGAPGGARWFREAGTEAPVGQFPTLSYCCHGLVVDQQEIGLVGAAQKPPFFSVALAPLTLLQSLANVGRRRSVHDPYGQILKHVWRVANIYYSQEQCIQICTGRFAFSFYLHKEVKRTH